MRSILFVHFFSLILHIQYRVHVNNKMLLKKKQYKEKNLILLWKSQETLELPYTQHNTETPSGTLFWQIFFLLHLVMSFFSSFLLHWKHGKVKRKKTKRKEKNLEELQSLYRMCLYLQKSCSMLMHCRNGISRDRK